MCSSLEASEEMIEFHTTQACSNLGLIRVQHRVRRLYSDEKEKVTVQINPKSLIA
jgi:hypothetical protein